MVNSGAAEATRGTAPSARLKSTAVEIMVLSNFIEESPCDHSLERLHQSERTIVHRVSHAFIWHWQGPPSRRDHSFPINSLASHGSFPCIAPVLDSLRIPRKVNSDSRQS